MRVLIFLLAWAVIAAVIVYTMRRYLFRSQVRRRLLEDDADGQQEDELSDPLERGILARWLYLAGFRRQGAPTIFLLATAAAIAVGLATAYFTYRSGILAAASHAAAQMPGGLGALAQPILRIAPWLLLVLLTAVPLSIVRTARRQRVAQVERDLPLTLELLATLAESGIGFDGATARILDSQPANRALAMELRTLQADLLAGRSRVECLRRVARRLDVISVTIFISAIVQAEQIGSAVAAVLRQQADDLRQRRRERALEISMALPVKQLFPLVICFLPGILIFAIGPLFSEFLRYAGTFGGVRLP